MSWCLFILLVLGLCLPARAWPHPPPTLTPTRRADLLRCQRTPPLCPPGTPPPSTAEQQALAASEATAERLAHATCADLLPDIRALWDRDRTGQARTYDEQMVAAVWVVRCRRYPFSDGP